MLARWRSALARNSSRLRTVPANRRLVLELLEDRSLPAVSFLGVAAGDASSSDAILWTRAQDPAIPNSGVPLIAQVATDQGFTSPLTYPGTTDPLHDYTLKIDALGLLSGTRYYYRFQAASATSQVGTFVTAPAPTTPAALHFGFTGDADGLMRPYDATGDFTAPGVPSFAQQHFDNFIWLGDTIYETASGAGTPNFSPAVPDSTNPATLANLPALQQAYWTKYRQQFLPVSTGSYPGLSSFFSSTGHYTLLDNHELGNKQLINGGAPGVPATGANATNPANDVNNSGTFINKTPGFQTLVGAYTDYQPIRVQNISAPGDPRTDGTQQLYFAQQWGANAMFFQLDDRSYRDIRLKQPSSPSTDDTGPCADNPGRTMLGQTQLNWFEQSLLASQAAGVTWKFVSISSPIDQIGAIGSGADGGKSWMGGYRAERNQMLKFIADHHIDHVVFLSTDDHQLRINELGYFTQFDASNTPIQSSWTAVPGAFEIVAGPIGATGPDTVTDHSFANVKGLANSLAQSEIAAGVNPIGLDRNFPGLQAVSREGDSSADVLRQPVDFYSPDTFNYATLDISANGRVLTVTVDGINSYAVNTFPQPNAGNPVRQIMSFQVVDTGRAGVFVNGTELDVVGTPGSDTVSISATGASTTGSTGVRVDAYLGGSFSTQTFTQSFTAIRANLGAGADVFTLSPGLLITTAVNADDGYKVMFLGGGNDLVNVKPTSTSGGYFTAGNGSSSLLLGTGYNLVFLGGGNNTVTVTAGSTASGLFQVGSGNNTLTLGGGSNTVFLGNGNNTVVAGTATGTGFNLIQAGNGNNNLTVQGTGGAVIMTGTGQDVIRALNGGYDYISVLGVSLIEAATGPRGINLNDTRSVVVKGTAGLTQPNDTLRLALDAYFATLNANGNAAAETLIRSRVVVVTPNTNPTFQIVGIGSFYVLIV
jgi:phosphodiesterase/alkaline phosphatase D-like protein